MAAHTYKTQRDKLASVAKALSQIKRDFLLNQMKRAEDLKRDDFLWHYLLQSFSTMGGAAGKTRLIDNRDIYSQMTFDALNRVAPKSLSAHISRMCAKAKLRYPKRKAGYIKECYEKCRDIGGAKAAKKKLLSINGRDEKILFLKSFTGIGDKYARNIMMDVYHPDFRNSIAIDSRIKKISEEWGMAFRTYKDHESFYLAVAKAAGINGWKLDRLMFGYSSVFHPPISAT